jgi:hypothetical protein
MAPVLCPREIPVARRLPSLILRAMFDWIRLLAILSGAIGGTVPIGWANFFALNKLSEIKPLSFFRTIDI